MSQYYTQLRIDLRENDYLPGNIYAIYQTDPIDKNDPEYSLYWRDGKVVRNEKGQAIYKFNHYDTIVQYDPIGYIDIHEFEFQ